MSVKNGKTLSDSDVIEMINTFKSIFEGEVGEMKHNYHVNKSYELGLSHGFATIKILLAGIIKNEKSISEEGMAEIKNILNLKP